MPNMNGTGPNGMGPMTGGGRGFCAVPLSEARPLGFGRRFSGRGCGRGRGWRNCYYATGLPGWVRTGYFDFPNLAPENEIEVLKKQSDYLKFQLDEIQNRISTLEKSASEDK